MKNESSQFGFSLLELLVVFFIIGLLSSSLIVNLNQSMKKSKDAKRISDISQLQTSLEQYYSNHGTYPDPEDYNEQSTFCGNTGDFSFQDKDDDDDFFLDALVNSHDVVSMPSDPKERQGCEDGYYYYYQKFDAGSFGCAEYLGDFYVLGAKNMEMYESPDPNSPGFFCPEKNWHDDFEWVVGRFGG